MFLPRGRALVRSARSQNFWARLTQDSTGLIHRKLIYTAVCYCVKEKHRFVSRFLFSLPIETLANTKKKEKEKEKSSATTGAEIVFCLHLIIQIQGNVPCH